MFFHQKSIKNEQKLTFFDCFLAKKECFLAKNRPKINLITAFLVPFWAILRVKSVSTVPSVHLFRYSAGNR